MRLRQGVEAWARDSGRAARLATAALLLAGAAVAPAGADALLDVELRPKDKVPCAEALGTELLLNAKETIPQIGQDYEDAFEQAIEKSNCKKEEILAFMERIGANTEDKGVSPETEVFYFLLKVYGGPWWYSGGRTYQ